MPQSIPPFPILEGAPNFRDLGGLPAAAGRTLRHRRLFRSDHLGKLGASDLAHIAAALGPAVRVLDFRGEAERGSAVCAIPGATVHSLPIEPSIVQKLADLLEAGAAVTGDDTVALMQDTYRNFVRRSSARYADFFGHVLAADAAPIVFHCTAGKDRTGLAAVLLLHALGVEHDVIVRDFLATNDRLAGRALPAGLPPEVAAVLWTVRMDFLQAALDVVDQDYGGLDGYLRDVIGVGARERAQLAGLYLD